MSDQREKAAEKVPDAIELSDKELEEAAGGDNINNNNNQSPPELA